MDLEQLNTWFPCSQRLLVISHLIKQVGLTRTRAECFVRLWVYLLVKQQSKNQSNFQPPLAQLEFPNEAVSCTHREAAILFYSDSERGSDRSAGMMLDKLEALGLIKKSFDGNTTNIEIQPIPGILNQTSNETPTIQADKFNPRSDTIPVANLLATNYNWMNNNHNIIPYRIAKLLRNWASQYSVGMRVLRRCDNLNPVGFYILYPTASQSEQNFFNNPTQGLHLSSDSDIDPFEMAKPKDEGCLSIFIRSWMIDTVYRQDYQIMFVEDTQNTLRKMQEDFPNICDMYALMIHPSYEKLTQALGFQPTIVDIKSSISWLYVAIDRFLSLDAQIALKDL